MEDWTVVVSIVHLLLYRGGSCFFFFFSSRRRHTRFDCDWSSDVCSSDLWGPTSDIAVLTADATPARSTGTDLMTVAVSGATISVAPRPNTRSPGRTLVT